MGTLEEMTQWLREEIQSQHSAVIQLDGPKALQLLYVMQQITDAMKALDILHESADGRESP